MKFVCCLSVIALKAEPSHRSEMVSQVLYGEFFTIIEEKDEWVKIETEEPYYSGWVQKGQYTKVVDQVWQHKRMVGRQGKDIPLENNRTISLLNGSYYPQREDHDDSESNVPVQLQSFVRSFADDYLDAPYLWGGRTKYGIDCSGLAHLFYRHLGVIIPRDAYQQAEQGLVVDFIQEIKIGDLAFFDNEEGRITHVGIMLDTDQILHASVKVRQDKLDSNGIYNDELRKYTHKLRIIKRYL